MKKYGVKRMTDPADLEEWSSVAFSLYFQVQILDYAWRYLKRQGDKTSKRRSEEIKKVLRHVSESQTIAVRAFVTDEIMAKCSEARMKWLDSYI